MLKVSSSPNRYLWNPPLFPIISWELLKYVKNCNRVVSGGGGKITSVSGEVDFADCLLQAQIRPIRMKIPQTIMLMSRCIQSGQLLIMTGETKLAVHIGHFKEVHYSESVMYIMTWCTFHFAIEKHIIINEHLDCSLCTKFGYTTRCQRHIECLHSITVNQVCIASEKILSKNKMDFNARIYWKEI